MGPSIEELRVWLCNWLAAKLETRPDTIGIRERFTRYGLSSLDMARMVTDLSTKVGSPLSPLLAFDHPTIEALARHVAASGDRSSSTKASAQSVSVADDEPVAIIGIGCRLPKAPSKEAFWQLLCDRRDAITEVPADRWNAAAFYDPSPGVPGRMITRWGGFLDQIDQFDPSFFGISPREATYMDPQQRLLLELSWEALEDAGIVAEKLSGSRTGVYVSTIWTDYVAVLYGAGAEKIGPYTVTGHHSSILANRISYSLGLRGPSMAIDAACASGVVALHLACQSLRCGESTLALVGGVNVIFAPQNMMAVSQFGALSPDGRCFTFDARANGFVRGEGGGVVVLKRLSQAITDGDTIYCVVRGCAVNSGGASNGLTAPNPLAQEEVLRSAYAQAGVDLRDVQYVEAHGTGTQLGDPIEARALGAVFAPGRSAESPLLIGSAKTNIGHLDGAAGIVGIIKAALCIQHRQLVPSLHFQTPSPFIPFSALHLQVQTDLGAWPQMDRPLTAGVSSFGLGGTNGHAVLQEWQVPRAEICPLSAESPALLRKRAQELLSVLPSEDEAAWLSVLAGRHAGPLDREYRVAITARSSEELKQGLRGFLDAKSGPGVSVGHAELGAQSLVFVCAGQGSEWLGMGRSLLQSEPVFRRALQECSRLVEQLLGFSLLDELHASRESSRLGRTEVCLPAIIATEIAVARLWESWGVTPAAVVGHSTGEIAAAHLAGILSLEDTMRTICAYGRTIDKLRGRGTMGLVGLSWEQAAEALHGHEGRVFRAIQNSVRSTVLAGEPAELKAVLQKLTARGVFCRPVDMDVSPHCPLAEPLRGELFEALRDIRPQKAAILLESEVSGDMLSGEPFGAAHWVRNFAEPVFFSNAIDRLLASGFTTFLEVSPHPLAKHALEANLRHRGLTGRVLSSMRRNEDARGVMLDTLGSLYASGTSVAWAALYPSAASSSQGQPCTLSALPFLLSGKTGEALRAQAAQLHEHLQAHASQSLSDVAYSLATTRSHFEHRAVVVAGERQAVLSSLHSLAQDQPMAHVHTAEAKGEGKLALLFTGQGSQRPGMGRQLYAAFPVFRDALDEICALCDRELEHPLLPVLFAKPGSEEAARLDQTAYTQPALFALEVGMFRLLASWGLTPDFVLGHSIGELSAAHVAGVLSLLDACRLVCARSLLMQALPTGGAMISLEASEEEVRPLLLGREQQVAIASLNGPHSTVLSGDEDAVLSITDHFKQLDRKTARLNVSHAFHSPRMEPMLEAFRTVASQLTYHRPRIPIISNVSGKPVPESEYGTAEYWVRQVREPVRFLDSMRWLESEGVRSFLELGPRGVLCTAGADCLSIEGMQRATLHSVLRPDRPEPESLFGALSGLHITGHRIDWEAVFALLGGRRVSLPTYPFQRQPYWLDAPIYRAFGQESLAAPTESPQSSPEMYEVRWIPVLPGKPADVQTPTLVLGQNSALAARLGLPSVADLPGLKEALAQDASAKLRVLIDVSSNTSPDTLGEAHRVTYAVLALLQAWLSEPRWARSELCLVTSAAVAAVAEDGVDGLANAPLWGLVRSVRSEYPEFVLRLLDIQGDSTAESVRAALIVQHEPDLALRGQKVLAPRLMLANVSPQRLDRPARLQRTDGTVLITGGTGALAQVVAHHLVKVHGVRHLLLTSRRGPEAAGARALRTELEQLGAQVTLSACDVTRREAVAALLRTIPAESPLSAVFHCAGTLDDGPVESLTADRIERVFGPKIDAALHLHELTAHLDLEAFVLFSSVAGVVGSPMKGNYAAANAFLDALAAYRHQRGQAAQSLAWGLWQPRGAGMTAELSRANLESIRRLEGIAPLSIEQGLQLLDSALAQPEAALVPVHLDVMQLARRDKPVPALFRGLIKDRASMPPAALGKGSDSVALCQRLAALPESDGLDSVVALVRSEVAAVLGLANAAAIPPDRQLKSLGLDSLMTLDLRNRLQARLGLRIDISLLRLPDSQSMAVEILRRCGDESSAQGMASERPAASASDEKIYSKVADRAASDPSAAAISVHRPQLGSLSASQQRLWFLHQALERPETYNLSIAFRVHSALHSQILMQALDAVTARHEQLRVCFIEHDGVPQQRVLPWVEPALQIDDLSHLPIEQRERTLAQKLSDQARQPFSLSQPPLLRLVLFQLGPTECVLSLTWHHIITDGVSLGIFFAELSEAYQTLSSGREPAWSRAPSYLRYCERSQAWLQTPEAQAQREWWRQELKDLQPLNLPTDRPAPKMSSKRGGCTTFDLSPASSRAVAELTAAAECTPFVVLFAAWSALLSRYCGQQDFAIGTDVVNRPEAELQNVLGFFVNTLPIRCDLSGDPSVAELLQRMRGRIWSVLDRQELPLNEVVRVALSWRQEDLSSSPLFCVGFVLEESRWFPRSFGGAALEPLTRTISGDVEGTAKFDLSMAVVQTDLGYRATLEYAQDLFDAPTVERLAVHYQRMLTAMAEDLKRPLSALPLLSDAERRQILLQWNATTAAYPKGCIPELFAQQVARTPDAVALFFEGQTLTYRELDARANQLAHYLQSLGVGREVRVGIYLERSLELPLAILGILKAGGAYVPLDPDSPHRRLGLVVEDAELSVLIGHSERLDLSWLGERESFTQVDLSDATVAERIAAMSEAPPACAASAHSLAYVIYTSGSTGTPKGVQMEHHSVLNLVESHKHRFGDQPSAVTLVSPVVSDPSVSNLLGALLGGHTLFVVDQSTWRDGEALLAYLRIHAIEVCDCTPALLRLLVEAGLPTAQGLALRMLLCGGEALPTALVQTLYAPGIHSRLTVVNLYGPTECCVDVTALDLSAQNLPAAAVVPLGRPLLNTRIYVLDHALRPVPIGVSGELCIGGAGVSRGYLNRPDLTAQKFVPDPFSDDASARLYKSGDLARFLADGTIEFLGRLDHQIKLRGYRIELGEVESELATHPDVHSCAVVVREDLPGDKRLCAYLVSRSAAPPSLASLREHLGSRLPEYMLPASFVFLPDLPLSANGKIDQKALPVPSSQGDREEYEPPSTALEQSLADIFATVLHLDRVGRNDNFFAIGGHSLLATQAISRIRSTLQIELPLRTLFEAPTVGGLAHVLQARWVGSRTATPTPIARVPRTGPLALSFAQQRLWFLDQLDPGSPAYNVPAVLRLLGPLNVFALGRALQEIVSRHETLRTTFASHAAEPAQIIKPPPSEWPLPVLLLDDKLPSDSAADLHRLVHQELHTPFSLETGPLLRTQIVRLARDHHILLMTMHHIVADGWSVDVLLHELATLYQAFCADRPSPLPALPVQAADVAGWQREQLMGQELQSQLAYWRQQLTDSIFLELPTDRPRPAVFSYRGRRLPLRIDTELTAAIKRLAQQHDATVFMALLSAFQILLARYSGQSDVCVGSPIANRTRTEMEDLIGFFANTLVLRTKLDDNPSFLTLLDRVRKVCLSAFGHQDLPFERLVEELKVERDASRNPLFQVMFVLQNAPARPLTLLDLTVEPVAVESEIAKFDLTLDLEEQADGSLFGALEYATDLFDSVRIERMAGHFVQLLRGVVANPGESIAKLPLLCEAEEQQILVEWNATEVPFSESACVHTPFEHQAMRTPDAVAVVFEDWQLTYRELNERANQLAHHLISLGVQPGTLVGLCMDRSLDLVVVLLAILKAGGAYVPLDPEYPRERLALMLEDAQPKAIVTRQSLADLVKESRTAVVLVDDGAAWQFKRADNPALPMASDCLAYVIFTSGSTGKPKGVAMPHRALQNLLHWQINRASTAGEGRTLHFSPVSFDVHFQELFATWAVGGALFIPRDTVRRDGETLLRYLIAHRIDRLFLPFVALQNLAECAAAVRLYPTSLKEVVTAGEQLVATPALRAFFAAIPGCVLDNQYGPTETHVVTAWKLCGTPASWPDLPPIGRPIDNAQVFILDPQLQLVPVGVPGEIYLGGAGLAQGYYHRPELTAERFIKNPFSVDGSARLYRTGDRGRYLPDGVIEFLGRLDQQVKLRGFRIELGEVEAVLAAQPQVHSCVAIIRQDSATDKRLVVYVVPHAGQQPTVQTLLDHMQEKLPAYMIPAAVVFLPTLPLSPNHKVDRKALPAPSAQRSLCIYEPPSTAVEQSVADIFAAVLHLERVGRDDNFFALGGHSLLATQAMSRIRSALGSEVALRALFESPTVRGLAQVLTASLGELQRPRLTPIARLERTASLALSFAQHRVWFLDQMERDSPFYNISTALRLRGMLNVEALGEALREIACRHESLRTSFESRSGQPVQIIEPPPTVWALPVLEVKSSTDSDGEAQLRRLAHTEAHTPFRLATGPLFRTILLRRTPEDHVLLLTMHHIISDGWSMDVLLREICTLYAAFCQHQPSPLPELPVQMADAAGWQREQLVGERLQSQLSYWKQQLAGCTPLAMPTDRPRPAAFSYRGRTMAFQVDAKLAAAVKDLAQQQGATIFMALLAAFQVLLARYSGQSDVCVGSPIANRTRTEMEGLIGFFTNTLVLRINLEDGPSFRRLLDRVKQLCLDAYANQDVPFERLVEELKVDRDPSRNPLFQVMFALQNAPSQHATLPGLRLEPMTVPSDIAKFDLMMTLVEQTDGSLSGDLEYATDLFDHATMQRLASHYLRLLAAVVDGANLRIGELPLLTETEQQQLVVAWNQTSTDLPARCVHQLFEEQVESSPDGVAVSYGDKQLSYRQLNQRANQLAHHLRSLGVGPDGLVGLCAERSLDMVVAMVAILKAGGAYVPLDPSYPAERLAFMLQDVEPVAVVAQSTLLPQLPPLHCPCVLLDEPERLSGSAQDNPVNVSLPHHLAYVIYTSGSTGQPRGVCVDHRAIVRLVKNTDYVQLGKADCVAQASTSSFDAATFEIWGALLHGCRLVGVPKEVALSPRDLAECLRQRGITTLFLTTALFNQIVRTMPTAFATLRQLLFGGEAVDPVAVRRVLAEGPPQRLLHVYGPTETTTFASWYSIHTVAADAKTIAIGRPIANTRIYLLDPSQKPVPIGVPGELYIGGSGVARGYHRQAEQTARKFIADPFSQDPTDRLYKTGDLGRFLPDGNIEFLGRMDHQIKLRGFRIELGEIELVLGAHPEVQSCVVLLREDRPGDKRLCAYVVPKAGCAPSLLGLRTYLGAKLPEYMIPADMVLLDDLPLNPNGKADRKALPAPSHQIQSDESEPPRTPVEQVVADVFAQILHMDRVGVHQNFFALGGHSLLATQVVSRISSALGLELPLRSLFDTPSVAALAGTVAKFRGSASIGLTDAIAVLPREAATALPMSFAQQRLWFIEQLEPGNPVYVVPAAIRLRGPLQIDAMRRALACIASRHEALRTRFDSQDEQPVQIIDPAPDSWPLPIVEVPAGLDLSLEEQVARLAQAEARISFDLRQGPLWRTSLLRLAAEHHVLLLTMHHIISDGWSVGVLSRELSALYSAFLLQHPSPLPPLSVQLADVSSWERAQSTGPAFLAQLAYWQTQLQSCSPLDLPTDRPRPPIFSYQGISLPVVFPPALTTALKRLSTEHGATLFMTLLAAWNLLLSRFSGQTDLCVGTPIAHRTRTETEPLIGFFANTLVLRTKLDLDQTFSDLLAQVRKTCLEAYANQDVPFERLVESLGVARDLSRNPLFQVMLVLQNEPLFALSLPDVVVEPLTIGNSTAKFDLILHLAESADGGLCGVLEFARDLWEPATMHRLLGHLVTLLHSIVASQTSALHALPLLTSPERHQLLVAWNHTAADFPQDQCFPQLFEEQAARTPDAVALVFAEQQLTYRQLNARANQLAHHLLSQGVGPDVLVALCLHRSLEMVIGMLGILKAGGAYLPIDPDYPQDRIDFLLSDAQPAVLVTKQALLPRFAALSVPSVCLDQGPWEAAAISNPSPIAGMENLVYVLYTSGSTGRPKGVMIPHRALASLLVALRTRFGLASGDVVLAVSPYTFDISVSELLAPLIQGATIVLAAREVAIDGPCLLELLNRSGASFLDATPTTYQLLFAAGWQGNSKMTLICTGEAMPKQLAAQLAGCSARVWNGYGPTEATVWASFWPVTAPVRQVLIGRPVANTQLYILDAHLNPVPIGVPGELHIGGVGLARGYLNRPELTTEKFIGNPFSAEPDSRLYKTGDLVRYLPDGNIEYLGRIDHQIKLRGHRIELGEVETALSTHSVVNACAVMVREDAPGVRQLVAYIVLQPDRTASIAILREHLLAKLPQYMVPAAFVFLAALPLSANGKVDRRALPAPNQQRGEQEYLAPRSPLEGQLAELFATVLHLDRVSVQDNFFALGGDSLLAIQLVSRARRSGLVVAVRDLFMHQSVAELAAAIVQHTPLSCVAQLVAGKANGAVLFIPGSGGALYPAMVFAQLLGAQRPVLGLTTPPLAGTGPMPETLVALGAGYVQEIAARVPTGPLVLIGHSFGVHVALELGFQLQAAGRQIERVVLLDAGVPQLFSHLHYDPLILLGVYVQLLGLPLQPATLTDQTLAEALQMIVNAMTAAGLGDADPAAWLNAMLVSAEASHTMALHWSPRAPQAPIHLFRALEPNAELPEDVPEDFGWSAYFPLASLQFIPGGHVSLILPPHATTTAQAVAALLSDPSSLHADSHS